jgi:hypothetical protein
MERITISLEPELATVLDELAQKNGGKTKANIVLPTSAMCTSTTTAPWPSASPTWRTSTTT